MGSLAVLEYRDAYMHGLVRRIPKYAGLYIKWPLDHFIKAHVKSDVFYGQV